MTKAEFATQYMEKIAKDDRHGYDQNNRWGNPDFDCSGLVIIAYDEAGVPVKKYGATYTGNMRKAFLNAGFTDVTKIVNLKTQKGLKRGDVLLTPNAHTAVYCGNGKIVHASINEKGKTRGGKAGDQTGKEICVRNYYNKPWSYVLRYDKDIPITSRPKDRTITDVAKDVAVGKYGSGLERKLALEGEGWNYREVQNEVNKLIKR